MASWISQENDPGNQVIPIFYMDIELENVVFVTRSKHDC
jgi:hypothetical protein